MEWAFDCAAAAAFAIVCGAKNSRQQIGSITLFYYHPAAAAFNRFGFFYSIFLFSFVINITFSILIIFPFSSSFYWPPSHRKRFLFSVQQQQLPQFPLFPPLPPTIAIVLSIRALLILIRGRLRLL